MDQPPGGRRSDRLRRRAAERPKNVRRGNGQARHYLAHGPGVCTGACRSAADGQVGLIFGNCPGDIACTTSPVTTGMSRKGSRTRAMAPGNGRIRLMTTTWRRRGFRSIAGSACAAYRTCRSNGGSAWEGTEPSSSFTAPAPILDSTRRLNLLVYQGGGLAAARVAAVLDQQPR